MTNPKETRVSTTPRRITPTFLSRYVRSGNCDRLLWLQLDNSRFEKIAHRYGEALGVTIPFERMSPLLSDFGTEFETDMVQRLTDAGLNVYDVSDLKPHEFRLMLREIGQQPIFVTQASLQGDLGEWFCEGRADVIRLQRDPEGRLNALVADIKASRKERMEHRLQVAAYARMLKQTLDAEGVALGRMEGAIYHRTDDGGLPDFVNDAPQPFDLAPYFICLDELTVGDNSKLNTLKNLGFEDVSYNLEYRCDGCNYNALCMADTAVRGDLSLVPYLQPAQKRALLKNGVQTARDLAGLKHLPVAGTPFVPRNAGLPVAPGNEAVVDRLASEPTIGGDLDLLVQRARAAIYQQDKSVEARQFLLGRFSSLPDANENPGLVKVFLDAQFDFMADRLYLVGALVVGPNGALPVVRVAKQRPTDNDEREMLIGWLLGIFEAVMKVGDDPDALRLHLYMFDHYDQKVVLEALLRNLDSLAAIPALFDLMTRSPALEQPIISFLSTELRERRNLGIIGHSLQAVASRMGFKWSDGDDDMRKVFHTRVFDSIRRGGDNATQHDWAGRWFESRSRFNSQIPLEYAYAAWHSYGTGQLAAELKQYSVTVRQIERFQEMRLRAMAHIESKIAGPNRVLKLDPIPLATLATSAKPPALNDVLCDFLHLEHYAASQEHLAFFGQPVEARMRQGRALLLAVEDVPQVAKGHDPQVICRVAYDAAGLDPATAVHTIKLKEGSWTILNPLEPLDGKESWSPGSIATGRLAIIEGFDATVGVVTLSLKGGAKNNSPFKYNHRGFVPQPGQLVMLDEMVDDLNGDKLLDACRNIGHNHFYKRLAVSPQPQPSSSPHTSEAGLTPQPFPRNEGREQDVGAGVSHLLPVDPEAESAAETFVDALLMLESEPPPTAPQRAVIGRHLDEAVVLVQGPPGTGKSHTLGWAILARIFAVRAANPDRPVRVAISSKTHNAVDIVLESVVRKWNVWQQHRAAHGLNPLDGLRVVKIGSEPAQSAQEAGVEHFEAYTNKKNITAFLEQPLLVVGATPGGLHTLFKYEAQSRKHSTIDWYIQPFDLVVIDEASQVNLPEGVLACAFLKASGQALIVGDHRQMPPILAHAWDDEAKRSVRAAQPYRSLFEYLMERGFTRVSLDESFRLHRALAAFLSDTIYRPLDRVDFHSHSQKLLARHAYADPYIAAALDPDYPIVVIEHAERNSQQYNPTEVELVAPIIEACRDVLKLDGRTGVGVVVPHRAQKAALCRRFPDLARDNAIDTVERFQGGERDVIIVSATVSDSDYVLAEADFLLDAKRLNVALSRPRHKLIVVASSSVFRLLASNLDTFEDSVLWKKLRFQYATDRLWVGVRDGIPITMVGRHAGE